MRKLNNEVKLIKISFHEFKLLISVLAFCVSGPRDAVCLSFRECNPIIMNKAKLNVCYSQ